MYSGGGVGIFSCSNRLFEYFYVDKYNLFCTLNKFLYERNLKAEFVVEKSLYIHKRKKVFET